MNERKKILAIIPARSGSKGLPDKNILSLAGKPMIAYSIDAAVKSGCMDAVIVSTDSERYAQIARSAGAEVPFLRNPKTATDTAGSWEVVHEVMECLESMGRRYDVVILLQPTSPLRTAKDIREAMDVFFQKQASAVISVCEVDHPPAWCGTLGEDHSLSEFIAPDIRQKRRQDLPTSYRLNGAIYIVDWRYWKGKGDLFSEGCYACVMPRERSLDIDTALDLQMAEFMLEHPHPNPRSLR